MEQQKGTRRQSDTQAAGEFLTPSGNRKGAVAYPQAAGEAEGALGEISITYHPLPITNAQCPMPHAHFK